MCGAAEASFEPGKVFPALTGFWEHWGFVSWENGPFAGVARKQRFVKDGILGGVAEYHAWDYILWSPGTEAQREMLWRSLSPLPDVMTQRFLFLLDSPWPKRRIRSFWLGIKGFVEFYAYRPGSGAHDDPKDLTGLVQLAMRQES